MTPETSPKPQQNIPNWLGPVIILGAVLMAIHGKPSPFFGFGGSGVASCKPAFAIAAILIWIFFAAVLWFSYLRKPPKD